MSLVFSDPTNKAGIVELIDATLKTNATSYPLAEKVRDVNLALDRALSIIFQAAGTWQFDDSNYDNTNGGLPIITTNLVAGQRDYSFVTDGSGNIILDIYKVLVADQNGIFQQIKLRDVQSETESTNANLTLPSYGDIDSFTNGINATGVPMQYDMTGNSIFLDPIPSYNATGGLKLYINREATYFKATDTTKKAGIAGIFHEYLALRAALKYATRNNMPVAGGTMRGGYKTGLLADVFEMEEQITTYYGARERDGHRGIKTKSINFR